MNDLFNTAEELREMMGTCRVCGRVLTDPRSLQAGIGPVCGGRHPSTRDNGDYHGPCLTSNFEIVAETSEYITLNDLGPWDRYRTITNDAENVVAALVEKLQGRRLFYFDSEDQSTELVISVDGKFSHFKPGI